MSLLWPNRLQLAISAKGVSVVALSTSVEKNKLNQAFVATVQKDNTADWQSASASLETLLSALQAKPNTNLSIVLSSDFVRIQLLPAQKISMNSAEKLAYAAAAYKDIYGSEMDSWIIKSHETGFNQASIVAALDKRLLEKLLQVAQQHHIKLVSVQPYLMAAYNSCKAQLGKLSGYFVVVEDSKILLLDMQKGQVQNLQMSAIGNDWQQDLKQLLLRESMLNIVTGQDVLVYAPANQNIHQIEGWHVVRANATPKPMVTASHFPIIKAAA